MVLAVAAYCALSGAPQSLILPLGLPDLPFHVRLDALSAFFLLLLGMVSAGISVYCAGYFESAGGGEIRLVCLQYHVFLASMALVLAGRRRLSVHGGLGDYGAGVVLSGHHRSRS